MADPASLIPIKLTEVAIGSVTPWPIYDGQGNLLLASGVMVETNSQLQGLIANGYYHDKRWDDVAVPANTPSTAPLQSKKIPNEEIPKKKDDLIEFDDARWHVGEVLQMQASNDPAFRFTVKLIGFIKGKSLLVTAPMLDGKYALIRDEQSFIIRAFPGKKAYAFTASAVKSVYSPHPYLHLSYPKQVRCTLIRQGSRAQVKIIAAVHLSNPERSGAATLTDLSVGGCSAIIKNAIGVKNECGVIKFKLSVIDTIEFLSLDFVLRSVVPTETGDSYRCGIEFTQMTNQTRLILSAFVHQAIDAET